MEERERTMSGTRNGGKREARINSGGETRLEVLIKEIGIVSFCRLLLKLYFLGLRMLLVVISGFLPLVGLRPHSFLRVP